ncbi:uncharacterized protein MKS88_000160 [Plasmodium brasilianum]|uniref:uncharacterized protein n=1 Tax=Plasmodium brasilianum TaxID=5824 RepID=UPI00350E3DC1|nr:hypothetical protein MKS88_000160 [Plasmodium brasilianum]
MVVDVESALGTITIYAVPIILNNIIGLITKRNLVNCASNVNLELVDRLYSASNSLTTSFSNNQSNFFIGLRMDDNILFYFLNDFIFSFLGFFSWLLSFLNVSDYS